MRTRLEPKPGDKHKICGCLIPQNRAQCPWHDRCNECWKRAYHDGKACPHQEELKLAIIKLNAALAMRREERENHAEYYAKEALEYIWKHFRN